MAIVFFIVVRSDQLVGCVEGHATPVVSVASVVGMDTDDPEVMAVARDVLAGRRMSTLLFS